MTPAELVELGKLSQALGAGEDAVRREPGAASHRLFLFQLLAVLGDYQRARLQLSTAKDLDPQYSLFALGYGATIECEAYRAAVFRGEGEPLLLGEPAPWMAMHLEGARALARGDVALGSDLVAKAIADSPPTPGRAGDLRFDSMVDGDSRLGPMLEAFIGGSYYWIPFCRIARIDMAAPENLHDLVWVRAKLTLAAGSELDVLLPARYPRSGVEADPEILLGRRTDWDALECGLYRGNGQRVWLMNSGELPILDAREVILDDVVSRGITAESAEFVE